MFYLQGLVNLAASRNGVATKAGRLSVFLPFRQGEADRTPKCDSPCGPLLGVHALDRHAEPPNEPRPEHSRARFTRDLPEEIVVDAQDLAAPDVDEQGVVADPDPLAADWRQRQAVRPPVQVI